jgi:hypothetical protein
VPQALRRIQAWMLEVIRQHHQVMDLAAPRVFVLPIQQLVEVILTRHTIF